MGAQRGVKKRGNHQNVLFYFIPLIFDCFSLPPPFFPHFASLSTLQTHGTCTGQGGWDGGQKIWEGGGVWQQWQQWWQVGKGHNNDNNDDAAIAADGEDKER